MIQKHKINQYLALMRFDKPIGSLLLLWPTVWGLWLASNGAPEPQLVWIFVAGVFVMRSAGCVINDYADKDFDPLVERTKQRPLAAGDLSTEEALGLFAVLSLLAIVLLLLLPKPVWPWAIPAGLVTIIYPYMKRFIQAPQAVLGLAFSASIPMVYTACGVPLDASTWLLMAINLCWVVAYDTAYAMSDREDDLKIGVKSTAILFGSKDKLVIGVLQFSVLTGLIALKFVANLSYWFLLSILLVAAFFLHQQNLIADRDRARCFQAFLNNGWVGAAIWLGILAG